MNYGKWFPIREYYTKFVIPLNPKRFFIRGNMMVCPLHNDHDPSLGVIPNKSEEKFHCFGCGSAGTVVDLHKRVCQRHLKKYLSDDAAIRELCTMFNVPYEAIPEEGVKLSDEVKRELAIEEAIQSFDLSDFSRLILEGKQKKKGIGYFNNLTMVMVSEVKEGASG